MGVGGHTEEVGGSGLGRSTGVAKESEVETAVTGWSVEEGVFKGFGEDGT